VSGELRAVSVALARCNAPTWRVSAFTLSVSPITAVRTSANAPLPSVVVAVLPLVTVTAEAGEPSGKSTAPLMRTWMVFRTELPPSAAGRVRCPVARLPKEKARQRQATNFDVFKIRSSEGPSIIPRARRVGKGLLPGGSSGSIRLGEQHATRAQSECKPR
jgi:hypothetical protein